MDQEPIEFDHTDKLPSILSPNCNFELVDTVTLSVPNHTCANLVATTTGTMINKDFV